MSNTVKKQIFCLNCNQVAELYSDGLVPRCKYCKNAPYEKGYKLIFREIDAD